ncbi:superinfection immunity protein [Pseudomonas emilianonis]
MSIFKLNLLTGWTGIGWLVALYRALVFPVTDK